MLGGFWGPNFAAQFSQEGLSGVSGPLGALWALSGCPGPVMGRSRSFLGAFEGSLGVSWGALNAIKTSVETLIRNPAGSGVAKVGQELRL